MLRRLIHRPIAVTMIVIAVISTGILSILGIPVSLMPDIDIPQITIHTSMPGASVREIEDKVTGTLRGQLMQVAGAVDVISESRTDASIIRMTFTPGADMDLLFIEVNEKIDRAMNFLPQELDRPKIVKASAMDIPAFYLDMSLKTKFSQNAASLSSFARNVVSKRLEQLPQTAMVDISGTVGTEMIISPDEARMDALGLDTKDIEQAINEGNITLEALSVRSGLLRYNIHFDSQILTVDDIRGLQIRHGGRLISLGELCEITERPAKNRAFVLHDGREAVTMAVIKQNDARMDDLQESVDALLVELRRDNPDISFDITRDQTQLLSFSIDNLIVNLLLGIVLACVILFAFMRNRRLPLLIIISIPLSLILTLMVFRLIGISLNIISLSGLILGVGMIIDNSIIVIDNIAQHKAMGMNLSAAVVTGTKEVFTPMLSSVLTTCSVFIPLVFISGTAGALFHDQAMGVAIALSASLLVAVTIVPVYIFLFFRGNDISLAGAAQTVNNDWLTRCYEKVLAFFFRNQKTVLAGFALSVIAVAFVFGLLKKERMPEVAHTDALMTIDWNTGVLLEENERKVKDIMDEVKEDIVTYTSMVGAQEFLLSHTKDITSSEAVVYIKAETPERLEAVQRRLAGNIRMLYPMASVDFAVSGNIYDVIFQTDESDLEVRLQTKDGTLPSLADVRSIRDSLLCSFPSLAVPPIVTENILLYRVDMEQMALYGVAYNMLYSRLRSLVGSEKVFSINDGAQSVSVIIGVDSPDKESVLTSTIKTREGTEMPLYLLVKPVTGEDYKRLYASSSGEYYPLRINADDRTVEDVMLWVKKNLKEHESSRLTATFSGSYFSSREMIHELSIVLLVALALLYFILAAQFESIIQPLIILSEMVVDVAAVFIVLCLMGESLNIMSMTGLVVMSGIIINDSILKIDTINNLRKEGHTLLRAIIEAGHRRLRPIVMTSLTTIFAILPMLSRTDLGSALQYPLSLTLIIGMAVGTFVSLFFVPLAYYKLYRK